MKTLFIFRNNIIHTTETYKEKQEFGHDVDFGNTITINNHVFKVVSVITRENQKQVLLRTVK